MREKIQALLEVRKIIALLVTILFFILCMLGRISSDDAFKVVLVIMSFYFGKSTALDKPE